MPLRTLTLTVLLVLASAAAPAQNPIYRANRSFYTSMWTANPPEYTNSGQTVAAGTMHWRAFLDQANQRREPRLFRGIGTWWQPSDLSGTFPQTIQTPEFRIYPTQRDAAGLLVPDVSRTPLLTVSPTSLGVQSGNAFNSLSITLAQPIALTTSDDFALCGVYPAGASATAPGFFGFLPSAANETYGVAQSYYGFVYPTGTITHFPLGGARSSLWILEDQPTLAARGNWAISNDHNTRGFLDGAFGDTTYFAPLADPSWPGWSDSRNPATVGLSVFANGRDGDFPIFLFNLGPRFPIGVPVFGINLEVNPGDPFLALFAEIGGPIQNGRFDIDLPLLPFFLRPLRGSFLGFEAALLDPNTFTFSGSTQSVWLRM